MQLTPPDMICFALYSAQHAMQQAYADLLDDIGLTYPQYLVMTALWAEDGRTVGALGRELQFLVSHTVHHAAMIAASCRARGLPTADEYGVAPSTLRHRAAITG